MQTEGYAIKDFLINEVLRDYNSNSKDEFTINKMASLKNETIEKPIIYIGAGTCGLGAGAEKTLNKTIQYLKEKNIEAHIIETGCIGLCSSEPIMDVQLPGYNRISFEQITEDKVNGLLDQLFKLGWKGI